MGVLNSVHDFLDRGMARIRNCEPGRVAYGPGVDLFLRVFVQSFLAIPAKGPGGMD
jgi:hypothetical protein